VALKAREQGTSARRYMEWSAVHGFLHLLGYDHERSIREEKKMFALEKKILKNL
jgi:probable rRNA maturation factor